VNITNATLYDLLEIKTLLNNGVKNGVILYRNSDTIATNIRSYLLVKNNEIIIGTLAIHIHTVELAEIRSLYVHEDFRRQGIANKLLLKAIQQSKKLGIKKLLTLTYQVSLFKKIGFYEIEKSSIPNSKIWVDCMNCQHFPVCDEVALIKEL
jgi:amino-acid N-acetyltransferase